MQPKTIYVALSGGVDSSVAALLLLREGHRVVGITMRQMEPLQECEAAAVAAKALGIAHEVVDLRAPFLEQVERYFMEEYANARTPNPCVICNQTIKFGALLEHALQQGADKIATGHYAHIREADGAFTLHKAKSPKDQSYFLHRLNQRQLAHTVFPLAHLQKEEIRAMALQAGLPAAKKQDSQEICFVPQDDYMRYLLGRGVRPVPGDFLDAAGKRIGEHRGLAYYTIGQRKGLGAFGRPMYVTGLDAANNTVTLGEEGAQYAAGLYAEDLCWISGTAPTLPATLQVKIRYRAKGEPATLHAAENGRLRVQFEQPVRSVTPGQFAVFYQGDQVLGGGRITQAIQ